MGSGLRAFLYGLGTAGNSFAGMLSRASDAALAHDREKELIRQREEAQNKRDLDAMTERNYREENEQALAQYGGPVKRAADYGRRGRMLRGAGPAPGGGNFAFSPDADIGPTGALTPQGSAAFRSKMNAGSNIDFHPATGAPMVGVDFANAVKGQTPEMRERIYPSAALDADVSSSPFARFYRQAMGAVGADDAKMARSAASAARQEGVGTSLRLAKLDDAGAAMANQMGLVQRSLVQDRTKRRGENIDDARTKAQEASDIGVAAAKTKVDYGITARDADRRTRADDESITKAADEMRAENVPVTPESLADRLGGKYPVERVEQALKRPMSSNPKGKDSKQEKIEKAARESLASLQRAIDKDPRRPLTMEQVKRAEAAFDKLRVSHDQGFVEIGARLPQDYTPRKGARPASTSTPTMSMTPTKTATSAARPLNRTTLDAAKRRLVADGITDREEVARRLAAEFGVTRNEIIRADQQK